MLYEDPNKVFESSECDGYRNSPLLKYSSDSKHCIIALTVSVIVLLLGLIAASIGFCLEISNILLISSPQHAFNYTSQRLQVNASLDMLSNQLAQEYIAYNSWIQQLNGSILALKNQNQGCLKIWANIRIILYCSASIFPLRPLLGQMALLYMYTVT